MFAANAKLDVGTGLLAELNSHLDEFAYAVLINACKGIALEDFLLIIVIKELPGIVAAEAESHLGKVIGAETEEFRLGCNFVRSESGAGDFDHGTDKVGGFPCPFLP